MSELPPHAHTPIFHEANCCPICGRPNDCRMETGEAFKGACWCAHLVVSAAALERLMEHVAERRCLCRTCLTRLAEDPEVTWDALAQRGPGLSPGRQSSES